MLKFKTKLHCVARTFYMEFNFIVALYVYSLEQYYYMIKIYLKLAINFKPGTHGAF